jgi:hypothetical protein
LYINNTGGWCIDRTDRRAGGGWQNGGPITLAGDIPIRGLARALVSGNMFRPWMSLRTAILPRLSSRVLKMSLAERSNQKVSTLTGWFNL